MKWQTTPKRIKPSYISSAQGYT